MAEHCGHKYYHSAAININVSKIHHACYGSIVAMGIVAMGFAVLINIGMRKFAVCFVAKYCSHGYHRYELCNICVTKFAACVVAECCSHEYCGNGLCCCI